jgi:hypothetical protein
VGIERRVAVGTLIGRAALGAALGAGAVFLIAIVVAQLYAVPRFGGAYAMAVAFVWMPVGAIAGALFGLLLVKKSR